MIFGIGVDIVGVARIAQWERFSDQKLEKIFSDDELADCMQQHIRNWEKVAARFAAKEAAYKALSQTLQGLGLTANTMSFLVFCKHICIKTNDWGPHLEIDWLALEQKLHCKLPELTTHLSLSHEKEMAVACVIIEKQ